jgi:hypothetical protein
MGVYLKEFTGVLIVAMGQKITKKTLIKIIV